MTHDGIPLGYIDKNGKLKCDHRVVEFCYLNRDGSYVSFDCKDDIGRTICQFKFDKEEIIACDRPVDLW